jgi:4-amino-4-deoxy-L-arabinose transferase-like glycosyltransferase
MPWARLTPAHRLAAVLILLVVAVGGVLRADSIGSNTHTSADERGYVSNANRILSHERYATFEWPPGTSFAFAVAARASGHRSVRLTTHATGPAQYAQLAAGLATLLLIAAIAWLVAGPWAALLATALAASYVPLIVATRTFLSEPTGGLGLLAAVAAAALARSRFGDRRWWLWLVAAGVIGGCAALTRGDVAVAMAVLTVGLALSGRPGWRRGLLRGGIYLGAVLLTLAPWLAYASISEKRFVPITIAGPTAFFIGSYLPGKGALVPTEEHLAPEVCAHFPKVGCGRYWDRGAQPLFKLIHSRYPDKSERAAVIAADLDNIDKYALGKPLDFAGMLWKKFWKMWRTVWSGGNGTYHPSTNQPQHTVYVLFAWLGLLAGALATRRWSLIVSAATLLAIAALATLFNDQPRYNVSLMPVLLAYGTAGAWLAGRWALERRRRPRAPDRAPPEQAAAGVGATTSA